MEQVIKKYYWSGTGSLATLNGVLVAPVPGTNIIETSDEMIIGQLDRMLEPSVLEVYVDTTDGISAEETEQLDTTAADKLATLKAAAASKAK